MGLCSSSELKEDLYPATPSSSTTTTIRSNTTRGSTRAPSTSSPRASKTSSSSSGGTQFSSYADSSTDAEPPLEGMILPAPNLKVFAYSDLRAATKGFRPDSILGEGGFGAVYKGWLDEKTFAPSKAGSGMPVAVKKLHEESMQGLKEWESEINFLGRLSHPNLVRLIGYSWDERELLLVYEYMQRGSLENHLFRRSSSSQDTISWRVRIRILIDAARALAFLHTSEKQVIYRDFKASNILLDANYNAKISDFGLAKNGPEGSDSHVSTRIMGTFGYAAPEYVATGHLYVKSDVYGFGVVLLEMISGLRAMDKNRPGKEQNLIEWLRPYLNDKKKLLSFVMDQRLEGKYPPKAAIEAAKLTLSCLELDPKNRPHMKNVVEKLEYIVSIRDKSPGESKPIPQGGSNGHYYQRQHQHHPRSPSKSPRQPGRAMHPRMDQVGNGIYGNQRSASPR